MTPLPDVFLERPFAHRAYHDVSDGRPENSCAAVQAAVANGYGIEIDLQLSKDGQAMVFHDYHLGRLTDASGPVRLHDAQALSQMKLLGSDEGIPTLAQILAETAGRTPLLIELKDQDGAMGPNIGVLESAVADALADYTGPVAVMSFNPHSVAKLRDLLPQIPRGLVTSAFHESDGQVLPKSVRNTLREIPDFERCGAGFISHQAVDLERPRVAELKSQGVVIQCWTIKSEQQERRARKVADNITFEQYPAQIDPVGPDT